MKFHPDDRVYIKPMDYAFSRYEFGGDYSGVVDVAGDGSWCSLYIDGGGWCWCPDELERQLPIGTEVLINSAGIGGPPDLTGTIVSVADANLPGTHPPRTPSPFGFWYSVQTNWLPQPLTVSSASVVPIDQDDSITTDPGDADSDPVAAEDLEPILFS